VRSSAVWPVLVGVGVLAGAVAAGIGALSLADALTATGLPNPGPATTYGLPFVRAAGEIAAVLAAGSFLFAAFLVPPQTNGVLDAGGYRALRLGTAASAVWTVCAALLVPLTVSDVSGHPLREHLKDRFDQVRTLVARRSTFSIEEALKNVGEINAADSAAFDRDQARRDERRRGNTPSRRVRTSPARRALPR